MHNLKMMAVPRCAALVVLCCGLTLILVSGCRPAPKTTPALQSLIAHADSPLPHISKAIWSDTTRFYAARQQTFAWVTGDGPTAATLLALDALRSAEAHGLDPARYGEPELRKLHADLMATEGEDAEHATEIARLDVRLTAALLHLARDVAVGRLAPNVVDARWNARRAPPEYVAALQKASSEGIDTFLPAVQPRHPEYKALQDGLASLRSQSGEGWSKIPRATLKVGQWNAAVVVPLRQRLATSGYLPKNASLDSPHYDADVELGVKAFQEHHALPATGKLDSATVDRLNVPIDARRRQVEMNLERWRWLPDDLGARHFIINVPRFVLIAREGGKPVLDIRVVVGKRGNETPLFSDRMEQVVFSPYWNVPETIALEETAPAVVRDPEFLARNNMEIIDTRGRVVSPDSIPWGDENALSGYRFRQRPGARNALGLVKFLFPNDHAVYLHDTPADALFSRVARAFSHGCIRVEEPEALAEYVLRDQPEWTTDAIQTAMHAGNERHVKLKEPIPVHIVYMTAWVDDQGGLHFQDDVYGYDARQAKR